MLWSFNLFSSLSKLSKIYDFVWIICAVGGLKVYLQIGS